MPKSGTFQKGYDPRRKDLAGIREATQFGAGNKAHLKHGLRGLSKRLDDPAKRIPAEFQVLVLPVATLEHLEENLAALIDAAAMAHDTLKDSPNVENLRAVGKFGQALTKMSTTLIQIQAGSLTPEDLDGATPEHIAAYKARLARTLSGDLTKVKHAYHYIEMTQDILDEEYKVFSWVEVGLTAVITSARTTIEKWARLLLWEQQKNRTMDTIEGMYIEALSE